MNSDITNERENFLIFKALFDIDDKFLFEVNELRRKIVEDIRYKGVGKYE